MQATRPGLRVRTAPYMTAAVARIIGGLQTAMLVVGAVVALEWLVGWSVVPGFLGGRTTGNLLPFALLALFLALQVAGASATSGAFEVVEEDTGKVVYSKLSRGRMPRTPEDILALVDAAFPPKHSASDADGEDALPAAPTDPAPPPAASS